MPRAFPLQAPLDHAIHRMRAAERMLRMLRRKEAAARQRLDEVRGYKREYQSRLADAGGRGLDIHLLRDYHVFLGKIEQAIRHQEAEVRKAEENWQAAHAKWLELRRQVKAYEVLAERHRQETLRKEERRDQRLTDETAARQQQPLGGQARS
ncbi:MAG: flagellar export protein FliJ [Pseudomonadota bacterium]